MKRIGLTQRVHANDTYPETRDCLDQNWARLLAQLGWVPLPLSNAIDQVHRYLDALALDGVILTGGNDLCSQPGGNNPSALRDRFETQVLQYAMKQALPVLGVCRGLQVINKHFGGSLQALEGHVAQRHLIRAKLPGETEQRERTVNSYHGWGLAFPDLGQGLSPDAQCEDGSIEALTHHQGKIHAIMWHPEREAPFDKADLALLRHIFEPNP